MNQDMYDSILRGIVPKNTEEIDGSFRRYTFLRESKVRLDGSHRVVVDLIGEWFNEHNSMPTLKPFIEYLKSKEVGRPGEAQLLEHVSRLPLLSISEFRDIVRIIRKEEDKAEMLDTLTEAVQIVSAGKDLKIKDGKRIIKKRYEGPNDGAQYILDRVFNFLDRTEGSAHLTSKASSRTLREEYFARKANPEEGLGILTGFESIDKYNRGMQPGDLYIVAGFAGHGKSTMCLNMTHMAKILGYNVLYFTLEMSVEKCARAVSSIHAGSEKFADVCPAPVLYSDIKNGSLSPELEKFYTDVVLPDLANPEYGNIWFEKPTSIFSIKDLMARAEVINLQMEVDLIVVDYVGLIEESRFSDIRDSLNHTIKIVKQWAMSFDNGRGVPILTPFQTNRHGYDSAVKNDGVYEITALSHATEAERSADVVVAIYAPDDYRAVNEAKITYLKSRDAETPPPRLLYADFARRIFKDMTEVGNASSSVDLLDISI